MAEWVYLIHMVTCTITTAEEAMGYEFVAHLAGTCGKG